MTVGQKASVSLLIATVLAAGFAVLAYSGLFNLVETRFFDARVRTNVDTSLDSLAASVDSYHSANSERFGILLQKDFVRRSFLPNQSAQDVFDRTSAFGQLQEQTPSLLGSRFIDLDGKRIHFSNFPSDISKAEELRTVYRNYGETGDEPFADISVKENSNPIIKPLRAKRAFAYLYPFVDGFGVYRGVAVFYVSFNGLLENLVRERHIAIGEDIQVSGSGIVFGAPAWGGEALLERIEQTWANGINAEPVPIGASGASDTFILFVRNTKMGALGKLIPASWFEFPVYMQWLLLAAFFVSVYLLTFLLFNIRQDGIAVLSARIKRLQIGLVEEYLDAGGDMDPVHWRRELEARRAEVGDKIRRNAGRFSKKQRVEVDTLINKGWDDIIAVLAGRQAPAPVTSAAAPSTSSDITRIEALLREALSRGNFTVNAGSAPLVFSTPPNMPIFPQVQALAGTESADEVEDLEEAESVDEAEELAEAEAADEVEDLEEAESVEEAEELAEAEAADEVEDLEEAEAVEEAEELAEAKAADDVVDLEEAEAADEIEELVDAEAVDEIEELVEAETVSEIEEPAEAEAVEEIEELVEVEAEAVEELEELADSESIGETASLSELGELSEVQALNETEALMGSENWGSLSAEAMAFAASSDDDIPVIPESLGLQLVEETNLADVQRYISGRLSDEQIASNLERHVREDDGLRIENPIGEIEELEEEAIEELEELEELNELEVPQPVMAEEQKPVEMQEPSSIIRMDASGITEEHGGRIDSGTIESDEGYSDDQLEDIPLFSLTSPMDDAASIEGGEALFGDEQFRQRMQKVSQDQLQSHGQVDSYLNDLEFDLFLDALDLSGLENYRDEEGFLELDMTEFTTHSTIDATANTEDEIDDVSGKSEIAMLSDADRERMEELQVVSADSDEDAEEALPIDYFPIYRRHELSSASRANLSGDLSELEMIGEEEPSLVESLGQFTVNDDLEDDSDDEHPAAPDPDGVISMKDGLFTLNPSGVTRGIALNPDLKALADDILSKS